MRLFLGISGIIAILFLVFPAWDLAISSYFYQPEEGFFLKNYWLVEIIDNLAKPITIILVSFCIFGFLFTFTRWLPVWFPSRRVLLFLFASLCIGPGIITHNVFKNHWDRARPVQLRVFGGEQWFTPPFVMTHRCGNNCSFVSGHAALGFFLMSFGLLAKRRKLLVYTATGTFALVMASARVLQGVHFFSDVLFAGVLVYSVSYALYYYVFFRKEFFIPSSTATAYAPKTIGQGVHGSSLPDSD